MVAIEDIMARTGASKRKVEEVAKGMGFSLSNEYPDEVEASVVAKMQSTRKAKKRSPATDDAQAATSTTVSNSIEQEKADDAAQAATSTTVSNSIEQDRADIDTQAQYRAAGRIISRNVLTAYYEATEDFTIPGLKEQVEHSRKLVSISEKFKQCYDIDTFLSQSPLGRMLESRESGRERLLNSNSELDELDNGESSD